MLKEGQWSGGLGHTIQSRIMSPASTHWNQLRFHWSIDPQVPFSPPLKNHTIPSVEHVSVFRTSR
ncbi:MAG: hypothetical protein CM15mP8_1490 [Methanobacteriota archaeon]|nr:MAG: hypothetical protein CM15mP8_1490 [Euryarchaeota archaeon]